MFPSTISRLVTGVARSMISPTSYMPRMLVSPHLSLHQFRSLTTSVHPFRLAPLNHTHNFIQPTPLAQNQQQFTLNTTQRALFHIKLKVNRHKRDRIGYCSRPHHASVKRFWQTGSGRLMRFRSGLNHKRRRKTKNQLRRLNKTKEVPKQAYRRLTLMMMLRPHAQFPPGMSRPVNKYWQPPKCAAKVQGKRWC